MCNALSFQRVQCPNKGTINMQCIVFFNHARLKTNTISVQCIEFPEGARPQQRYNQCAMHCIFEWCKAQNKYNQCAMHWVSRGCKALVMYNQCAMHWISRWCKASNKYNQCAMHWVSRGCKALAMYNQCAMHWISRWCKSLTNTINAQCIEFLVGARPYECIINKQYIWLLNDMMPSKYNQCAMHCSPSGCKALRLLARHRQFAGSLTYRSSFLFTCWW